MDETNELIETLEKKLALNHDDAYLSDLLYQLGMRNTNCVQPGISDLITVDQLISLYEWNQKQTNLLDSDCFVRLYGRIAGMDEFLSKEERLVLLLGMSNFFISDRWQSRYFYRDQYRNYVKLEKQYETISSRYVTHMHYIPHEPEMRTELTRQYQIYQNEFCTKLLSISSRTPIEFKQRTYQK